jgi:hypothetical protein
MRTKTYMALSVAALLLASVVIVACSSGTKCTANAVDITIELDESAVDADRVIIFTNTPAATLTVPHVPGDVSLLHVPFTFPTGYPSETYIEMHFQAYGGVTLLGVDVAPFHSGATCSSIEATIAGNLGPDMATTD